MTQTPDELHKQWLDDQTKMKKFEAKWGGFWDNFKLGAGLVLGLTLILVVYYTIGRLFNVCEIVRWIFCKSC